MSQQKIGQSKFDILDDDDKYQKAHGGTKIDTYWKPWEKEIKENECNDQTVKGFFIECVEITSSRMKEGKRVKFWNTIFETKHYGNMAIAGDIVKQRIEDNNIQTGDGLRITYTGKRTSRKTGNDYNTFDVDYIRVASADKEYNDPDEGVVYGDTDEFAWGIIKDITTELINEKGDDPDFDPLKYPGIDDIIKRAIKWKNDGKFKTHGTVRRIRNALMNKQYPKEE